MLKRVYKNRVESDAGFSIQISGLESLKYEDKKHLLELEWNYDPRANTKYTYLNCPISSINDSRLWR